MGNKPQWRKIMLKNNEHSDEYLNEFYPLEVKVIDGNINEAIARFRGMVTKERIMSVLKEHYAYEKPSEKKRRKQRESAQRTRKAEFAARQNRETKDQ